MNNKSQAKKSGILLLYLAVTLVLCGLSLYLANAIPQGATVSGAPSVDTGPNTTPDSRTDDGGEIITLVLDLEQQNDAWKAYVGNVTGTYVLKSSNNFSIYEWPIGTSVDGEVYISRNDSLNFSSGAITCATLTEMSADNTFFGLSSTATDNVNGTFNATNHSALVVGENNLGENTCYAIALWVNDTVQTPSPSAVFQEVALHDGINMVYTSIINNNRVGFDNTTTYDFQAIIPENRSGTGTQYFFYLELGT
ncbi:hypothetical protein KY348_03525 [Candidatus Woesearchaeota archaeon]|nr:hypothetical protein [Candidatus Woesearchaeota archaeon]